MVVWVRGVYIIPKGGYKMTDQKKHLTPIFTEYKVSLK
jgi:hypothetical protein